MSVQDNLNYLLWDRRYLEIPDNIPSPNDINCVVIRDFTVADRNYYLMRKKQEEFVAKKAGVSTEVELMQAAKDGGYWTEEDDLILKEVDSHVTWLQSEIEANKKFRSRTNLLQKQLDNILAKKLIVSRKLNEIKGCSIEYLAHELAAIDLMKRVVYTLDEELLFYNDNFLIDVKNIYNNFFYYVLSHVIKEKILETKELREIARSAEWRLIWTLNRKNLLGLFNRPIGDLAVCHKLLIYWSRIYDSVFEGTEPPDLEIINNDDKFDEWLLNKELNSKDDKNSSSRSEHHQEQMHVLDEVYIEQCTCGAKEFNKGKYLGEKKRHDNSCLFGTKRRLSSLEKQEIANRIYGRNSKQVRSIVNKEQELSSQAGAIDEKDMRKKQTRLMLGMKSKAFNAKK